MDKYVIVCNVYTSPEEGGRFLSRVDKNGLHFTQNIDDAIVLDDQEKCVFLARSLTRVFRTVDVYLFKEETVRSFEYVW